MYMQGSQENMYGGLTKENKQALRKRSKFFPFYSDVYNTTIVSLHCYILIDFH